MSEPIILSAPDTLFKPSEIIGILRYHLATGWVLIVVAVIIIVFIHKGRANERARKRRLLNIENECKRLKKDYPDGYRRYAYLRDMELPYNLVIGKKSLIIEFQQEINEGRKRAAEQDESLLRSQQRFSADCKAIVQKHVPKCGLYSYSIPWNKHLPNGGINKSSLNVLQLFPVSTFSEQDIDYYQTVCLQPDYSLDDLYILFYLAKYTFDHLPDYKNKEEQLPEWIYENINCFLNELSQQYKICILINHNIKDWDNEALSFHYQGINKNIPNTQIVSSSLSEMPIPDDTKYLVIVDCYTENDILIDNCKKIFNQPNPPRVIYLSLLKCRDREEMTRWIERKKKEIDELVVKLTDEWMENDKKLQEERFLSNYKRIKDLYPNGTEYYENFKVHEAGSIPKIICRNEEDVAKYDILYTKYLSIQQKYPRGIKEFEQRNISDSGEALVKYNIEAIVDHENEISQLEQEMLELDIIEFKNNCIQLYLAGIPVNEQELLVDYDYKSSCEVDDYPFYYSPLLGTPIFPYRRRKILREGVSEQAFYLKLKKYIDCDELSVYNDVSLQVSNQYHYELDIAVVANDGRNLRIDIEIDEPYSGYSRTPIHCIGYDDTRDQTLINLGWLVIRISEEQIVTSPLNCIIFISKIISDILPSFEVPESLLHDINDSKESFYLVSRWTKEEACVMAGDKYRELYLNRSGFGYVEDLSDTTETSGQTITESILSSNAPIETNITASEKEQINTSSCEQNPTVSQTEDEIRVTEFVKTHHQTIITLPKQRENRIEVISPYDSTIEEIMRPYFSSMSQDAYKEYDKDQHRLEQEILLYYGSNKRKFTESTAFGLIKEYIKTNNMVPRHAGMQIGHPSYHITGRIGFVVGDTLYDAKILRLGARGEDVGLGVAASLGDVPRSRYEIEETIKAEIVEQILNTSIKNMVVLEVNLRTNRVSEVKLRRNKVARFILNDGKYDMSIRKI